MEISQCTETARHSVAILLIGWEAPIPLTTPCLPFRGQATLPVNGQTALAVRSTKAACPGTTTLRTFPFFPAPPYRRGRGGFFVGAGVRIYHTKPALPHVALLFEVDPASNRTTFRRARRRLLPLVKYKSDYRPGVAPGRPSPGSTEQPPVHQAICRAPRFLAARCRPCD